MVSGHPKYWRWQMSLIVHLIPEKRAMFLSTYEQSANMIAQSQLKYWVLWRSITTTLYVLSVNWSKICVAYWKYFVSPLYLMTYKILHPLRLITSDSGILKREMRMSSLENMSCWIYLFIHKWHNYKWSGTCGSAIKHCIFNKAN